MLDLYCWGLLFLGGSFWAFPQEPPASCELASLVQERDEDLKPCMLNELFLVRHFAQLSSTAAPCAWRDRVTVDERIAHALEACGPDDLAVIDLDDTCFETEDPTFQTRYRVPKNEMSGEYAPMFQAFMNGEKRDPRYMSRVSMRIVQQKRRLIEPCIARMIYDLQCKGTPVIALSSFSAGAYGCIEHLGEHKYAELSAAGIDLERVVPDVRECELNEQLVSDMWRREPAGTVAVYRNILSASRQPKGFVLNRYIAYMEKRPRRVYFFDDEFENHVSVLAALKRTGIPLTSFLYTGAEELFSDGELDIAVARTQLRHMHDTGIYISYADACERVHAEPKSQVQRRLPCHNTLNQIVLPGADAESLNGMPGWHIDCAAISEGDEASDTLL